MQHLSGLCLLRVQLRPQFCQRHDPTGVLGKQRDQQGLHVRGARCSGLGLLVCVQLYRVREGHVATASESGFVVIGSLKASAAFAGFIEIAIAWPWTLVDHAMCEQFEA